MPRKLKPRKDSPSRGSTTKNGQSTLENGIISPQEAIPRAARGKQGHSPQSWSAPGNKSGPGLLRSPIQPARPRDPGAASPPAQLAPLKSPRCDQEPRQATDGARPWHSNKGESHPQRNKINEVVRPRPEPTKRNGKSDRGRQRNTHPTKLSALAREEAGPPNTLHAIGKACPGSARPLGGDLRVQALHHTWTRGRSRSRFPSRTGIRAAPPAPPRAKDAPAARGEFNARVNRGARRGPPVSSAPAARCAPGRSARENPAPWTETLARPPPRLDLEPREPRARSRQHQPPHKPGGTHQSDLPVGAQFPSNSTPLGTAPMGVKVYGAMGERSSVGQAGPRGAPTITTALAHRHRLKGDQFGSGFVAANPNSKIPALVDRVPGPEPVRGLRIRAAMPGMHLAEEVRRFPSAPSGPVRAEQLRGWLMWADGLRASWLRAAASAISTPEGPREISLTDRRLCHWKQTPNGCPEPGNCRGSPSSAGADYSIADMAMLALVRASSRVGFRRFDDAGEFLDVRATANVLAWAERIDARPAGCSAGAWSTASPATCTGIS